MMAATDTITITRRDFREAVMRCAELFRDAGLDVSEELTAEEVKLMTTVAVGFAGGLETELFNDEED